jgi:hypothetical protein
MTSLNQRSPAVSNYNLSAEGEPVIKLPSLNAHMRGSMVMQDQAQILTNLSLPNMSPIQVAQQLPDIMDSPRNVRDSSCYSLGNDTVQSPRPFTLNIIDADSPNYRKQYIVEE